MICMEWKFVRTTRAKEKQKKMRWNQLIYEWIFYESV